MPDQIQNGLITVRSSHSVDQTVSRLQQLLEAKGIRMFALVDHSGEAEKAGFSMPNTKLILFGNPKAGTPLMLSAPSIAIDLPLKILIWESAGGETCVTYDAPEFLAKRHGVPADLMNPLNAAAALANQIAH
jgi:uncharacterized protein (DUF302 family)